MKAAAAAAKKKSGKWDQTQYFYLIVLYFVACMSFSCAGASFLPFFDKRRRARQPRDWTMFFWCCSCLVSPKKVYHCPPPYWLVLLCLCQWQPARHQWKHRWRCRWCCRWSWSRPDNYFCWAQSFPPSYLPTVSTGLASRTSGASLKNIVMKTRPVLWVRWHLTQKVLEEIGDFHLLCLDRAHGEAR